MSSRTACSGGGEGEGEDEGGGVTEDGGEVEGGGEVGVGVGGRGEGGGECGWGRRSGQGLGSGELQEIGPEYKEGPSGGAELGRRL